MSCSIFGWDLPPGCTHADIDRAMGADTCELCEGTGKITQSPCCEEKILNLEEGHFCSECKKRIENIDCPDCDEDPTDLKQREEEERADD